MDLPEGGPNVGLTLATGSSKAEQTETTHLENPANEAPGPQFDFSTIGNFVSTFLYSVRQPYPEEQREDSLQNVEMSHGEPKRADYVDDLDFGLKSTLYLSITHSTVLTKQCFSVKLSN